MTQHAADVRHVQGTLGGTDVDVAKVGAVRGGDGVCEGRPHRHRAPEDIARGSVPRPTA